MKFAADKKALAECLTLTNRAVNTRGGLFVLTGVHISADKDGITFTGTDLETTIRTHLQADVAEPGVVVAPSRLLSDIVRAMPDGTISVSLEDQDELRVAAARSEFRLRTLPAKDWPTLEDHSDAPHVTLPTADLASAFRQVTKASSNDDARPILTGVLMTAHGDGLRLVATDSYRLALRDIHGLKALDEGQNVLVPGQILQDIGRVISTVDEIVVRLAERSVVFEIATDDGWTHVTSRLIVGDFPSYAPLIPDSTENTLTIERGPLLDAVRRMRLLSRDTNAPVRTKMHSEGVSLTVISQDIGEATEELDGEYDGEELEVAFNPDYLIEGLESTDADTVTVSRLNTLKPAVLRGQDDDDYLYLLMPVRVS